MSPAAGGGGKSPAAGSRLTPGLSSLCLRGRVCSQLAFFFFSCSENEALWREVASLRQKHAQQQKVVNKVSPSSWLAAGQRRSFCFRTILAAEILEGHWLPRPVTPQPSFPSVP